jgi:hypothetical protein
MAEDDRPGALLGGKVGYPDPPRVPFGTDVGGIVLPAIVATVTV